eukprot:bmy_11993T0
MQHVGKAEYVDVPQAQGNTLGWYKQWVTLVDNVLPLSGINEVMEQGLISGQRVPKQVVQHYVRVGHLLHPQQLLLLVPLSALGTLDADRTGGREEQTRLALRIRAAPGEDSPVSPLREHPRSSRRRRQGRRSLRSLWGRRRRRRRRQRRRRRRLRHSSRLSSLAPRPKRPSKAHSQTPAGPTRSSPGPGRITFLSLPAPPPPKRRRKRRTLFLFLLLHCRSRCPERNGHHPSPHSHSLALALSPSDTQTYTPSLRLRRRTFRSALWELESSSLSPGHQVLGSWVHKELQIPNLGLGTYKSIYFGVGLGMLIEVQNPSDQLTNKFNMFNPVVCLLMAASGLQSSAGEKSRSKLKTKKVILDQRLAVFEKWCIKVPNPFLPDFHQQRKALSCQIPSVSKQCPMNFANTDKCCCHILKSLNAYDHGFSISVTSVKFLTGETGTVLREGEKKEGGNGCGLSY